MSYTSNLNLYRPVLGQDGGWGDEVSNNFTILDTLLKDYGDSGYVKLVHLSQDILDQLANAGTIADNSITLNKLVTAARAYDVSTFYPGRPSSNDAVLLYHVAARPFSLVQSAGHVAKARTAPNKAVNFLLVVDTGTGWSAIGNVAFTTGNRVGTVTLDQPSLRVAPGNELGVINPSVTDSQLADISITLFGTLVS